MKYKEVKLFDVNKYKFNELLQTYYSNIYENFTSFDKIHNLINTDDLTFDDKNYYNVSVPKFGVNDRNSCFVNSFLKYFDTDYNFLFEYISFIKNEIKPLFPNETQLLVQKTPNIRFHLPGFSNIGRLNTDPNNNIIGLHKDSDFNHSKEEFNIILPITDMYDTNSIFHETMPDSKLNPDEFESLSLKKNEFCKIYFNKCLHYNKINDTDNTRVSFDFRVIPYSKYSENHYKLSATGKNKFIPGDYFMYC